MGGICSSAFGWMVDGLVGEGRGVGLAPRKSKRPRVVGMAVTWVVERVKRRRRRREREKSDGKEMRRTVGDILDGTWVGGRWDGCVLGEGGGGHKKGRLGNSGGKWNAL